MVVWLLPRQDNRAIASCFQLYAKLQLKLTAYQLSLLSNDKLMTITMVTNTTTTTIILGLLLLLLLLTIIYIFS